LSWRHCSISEWPPVAYALWAHYFSCTKDIFAASRVAEALTRHGIAVFRFDFQVSAPATEISPTLISHLSPKQLDQFLINKLSFIIKCYHSFACIDWNMKMAKGFPFS